MSHRRKERKVGREPNDFCPCNSGKKYKKCCGAANILAANRARAGYYEKRVPQKLQRPPEKEMSPAEARANWLRMMALMNRARGPL